MSVFKRKSLWDSKYIITTIYKKEPLSLDHLRKGIEDSNLTKGQKGLKDRIPLILKNYEELLPAIFSKESRDFLGINDYYILYIVVIIYFESHRDFLLKTDIPHYHFLSVCHNLMEKKFQNTLNKYHDSGMMVLRSLIDNRKNKANFCSVISEDYFKKIEEETKKFLKNSRKQYKKLFNHNKKSNNTQRDEIDFSDDIIFDAEFIIKLKGEKIPKKTFDKTIKHLPKGEDLESFKRVLPVLKELVKLRNMFVGSMPKSGYFENIYEDDFKQIQNKITFDFFLLYSHLEKEKWKENFARLPIKKWYLEKILRIVDFSETPQHEILKEIKEN